MRNFYFPSRHAYVPFLDTTLSLRERYWPEPELRPRHYKVLQLLELAYYRRAWAIVVAGDYVREELISFYGVDPKRIAVVGAGLGNQLVHHEVKLERNPNLVILFVGKEFDRKGGKYLLQALGLLKDVNVDPELWIVGPEAPVSAQPGINVTNYGRVHDREKLAEIYSQADIFCLPALFEPYGLVVLEAIAHGLPVVTSDVGALPEIVGTSGAGLLVPPRDAAALGEALHKVLADASLREEMGRRAYLRANDFGWAQVADIMLKHFKKIRAQDLEV